MQAGRHPAATTRSIHPPVSYDRPAATRDAIDEAAGAPDSATSSSACRPPAPDHVARWVADEHITAR
jgi:hypothetical protein